MAGKKIKHGKVERKKPTPKLRFRFGCLFLIVCAVFAVCFMLHMYQALTTENYWQNEIFAKENPSADSEAENPRRLVAEVANPVPQGTAAEESWLERCAWVSDEVALERTVKTASELYFSDAVSDLSDARIREIGTQLEEAYPSAIYFSFRLPEDAEEGIGILDNCIDDIMNRLPGTPLYILSTLPTESNLAENRSIDKWNSSVFRLADAYGIHFVDISTPLKDNSGCLAPGSDALEETLMQLILTHTVKE